VNKKLPLVSIVVLNWNGKKFVDPFFYSIKKQRYPMSNIEILFTDNGSTDGSIEYVKRKYLPIMKNLIIVENKKNFGYAKGNNLGIRKTSGTFVLICNNDIELDEFAIYNMVQTALKNNADVTCAKLLYLNKPGIINNAGSRLDVNSDWPIYEIGINEKDNKKYQKDYEISAFCGACILVKRDFFKTVGLFDKRFFLYFEDGDLSWRGQKAGKKYYFASTAIVKHYHTGSSKEGSPIFNHFVGRNRILILTKNGRFRYITRAWVITIKDQMLLRCKRLFLAILGKYPAKLALKEFYLSQKMIFAAIALTPYALLKRYRVIPEERL
jgi:GT2 family glycosyltransferase